MLNVLLVGSQVETLLNRLRERGLDVSPMTLDGAVSFPGQPDAIVVDIRSMVRLPSEIAVIKRRHPGAGVVIVGRALDPADLLESMRMGANEWVVEPVGDDDLLAAIYRVARPVAAPVGRTFAIVGAKGGVGSTTVAVNLATSMTLVSKTPALLIDLHAAFGDAALFLGVEPRFSVTDALENIDRLDETYLRGLIVSTPSGVDLLASSHRTAVPAADAKLLRRVLDLAASMYRFVVLDCPRNVPPVLEAIDGSTQIVVVANQELPALRSATRLVSVMRQRCGADRVKVAITRFDPRADIGRADIEKALGGAMHYHFPNDYQTSVGAMTRGEPLIVSNHSRLASSMTEFARQLGGFEQARKDAPKQGLFGRLGGRR